MRTPAIKTGLIRLAFATAFAGGFVGILLWSAVIAHAAITIKCFTCLRRQEAPKV